MHTQFKLAISPIGWSNDDVPELGGDISFEQCIQEMALAGYQGCEIGKKFPRDPAVLLQALASHKLEVASGWYSLHFTEPGREHETIAGFIKHMNFLKMMKSKVIVVCECGHSIQTKSLPLFSNKPIFKADQWQKLIVGLHDIGRIANENEMRIVYHYHMGTGIQQTDEISRLMRETDEEVVSLLLDTGHAAYAGENPLELLDKYGKRIKHVHLKDVRKDILNQVKEKNFSFIESVKAGIFTVPGDGDLDFQPILQKLVGLNYQEWVVVEAEQDPAIAHPLTYAKKAKENLEACYWQVENLRGRTRVATADKSS